MATPHRLRCTDEISKPVNSAHRSFLKRRYKKGARHVGWMMLHPVHTLSHMLRVQMQSVGKDSGDIVDARGILHAVLDELQAGAPPQSKERLMPQMRPWIARDGEIVYCLCRSAGHLEAGTNRLPWKPGPVFHPPKAFFLYSRHQFSIAQQHRGDIAVIGVDAQNEHDQRILIYRDK